MNLNTVTQMWLPLNNVVTTFQRVDKVPKGMKVCKPQNERHYCTSCASKFVTTRSINLYSIISLWETRV